MSKSLYRIQSKRPDHNYRLRGKNARFRKQRHLRTRCYYCDILLNESEKAFNVNLCDVCQYKENAQVEKLFIEFIAQQ